MKKWLIFLLKWGILFGAVSVLIFGLVRMMPISPAEHWLMNFNLPHTEENIEYVTKQMGLDLSLIHI